MKQDAGRFCPGDSGNGLVGLNMVEESPDMGISRNGSHKFHKSSTSMGLS